MEEIGRRSSLRPAVWSTRSPRYRDRPAGAAPSHASRWRLTTTQKWASFSSTGAGKASQKCHGHATGKQPFRAVVSAWRFSPGVDCHVAQIRIYAIGVSGKKLDVLLSHAGGIPMDPAVFGYIRVSQAEGESGLTTQRRILNDHGLRDETASSPTWLQVRTCAAHHGGRSAKCSNLGTRWWSQGLTAWRGISRRDSGPSKSFTARTSTSVPWRRDWTPATTAPPPVSCSICCSPWRSGSGTPSGTGSKPAWPAPRPRGGPGQASGGVIGEGGGSQGLPGKRRFGQRRRQDLRGEPPHRACRQGQDLWG